MERLEFAYQHFPKRNHLHVEQGMGGGGAREATPELRSTDNVKPGLREHVQFTGLCLLKPHIQICVFLIHPAKSDS